MTTGVLRAGQPPRARGRPPRPRRGRFGLAVAASVLAHAAAIGPLVWWRRPAPPALPPVYQVELIAAPPGPRAIGTVSPEPPAPGPEAAAPAPAAPTPPAPAAPKPAPAAPAPAPKAAPVKAPPKAEARPAPAKPAATPTPAPPKGAKAPTKAAARPTDPKAKPGAGGTTAGRGPAGPRAGGGPEGGRGSDVANVSIKGLPFPYPGYLQNIVRQVALRFAPPRGAALQADVAFLIHRDGSVSDIRVVKPSGNYAFDLEAQGAVEAAGSARAFGALPQGFRDDVLPVTFSFDPRVLR